ncbi:uncharacterized protein BN624_01109 [Clostridium sp. CAG:356]|jgi:zeta toxin family protein|nr:uncharacterized protein BN624_01109 [Clostridium sp. CAG:356]
MEQSIKDKYKLSEEEHNKIYKEIEKEVFVNSTPQDEPIAIIVGGQPGCGKGGVIAYTKNQVEANGKCIILITTDEYKPYHPNAIEIARKYPTEYVEIVEQDAGPWTGSIMKKAIDDKHNFIFEGTLKNDRILDRIQELKQNGFNVTVRVLAVPRLESLLTVHERYEKQMEVLTYGRLISIEHHNKAYDGIPAVVDKIEKSGLCTVEVYLRGDEIGKPVKVYSSKEKNERFPTARIALEEYRKSEGKETIKTAKTRVNKLRESFVKRNAKESELKQLDELENYWINKPIEK